MRDTISWAGDDSGLFVGTKKMPVIGILRPQAEECSSVKSNVDEINAWKEIRVWQNMKAWNIGMNQGANLSQTRSPGLINERLAIHCNDRFPK